MKTSNRVFAWIADRAGAAWVSVLNLVLLLTAWVPAVADESSPARAASAWKGGWKAGLAPGQAGPSPSCHSTSLVVAYVVLWVILLAYVLRLAARVRGLRSDVDELRREIRHEDER